MVRRNLTASIACVILLCLISGCNFQSSQEEMTPDNPATVAARTLQVVYTNVASQSERTTEASHLPSIQVTQAYTPSSEGDETCTNRAHFVEDVTIRDNMQIQGGESFNKIWRLRNDGTCIWNRSYALTFFGGERMQAPRTISLPEVVQPGQSIDLSIDMTAPVPSGMHQGFWRLRSDTGEYFGIGASGDQSFWVKIFVPFSLTSSPALTITPSLVPSETPSPSETSSPTMSPTPSASIYSQGTTQLTSGQTIDLEDGQISPSTGEDLALIEVTTESYAFSPQNNALFVLYTGQESPPTRNACESIAKTSETIPLTDLAVNNILCYSTDEGRPGYLTLNALNSIVDFTFITWVP